MEPEKKLWTAEIEIYRLVMSNGEFGDWNLVKSRSVFRFRNPKFGPRVGFRFWEPNFFQCFGWGLAFWSTVLVFKNCFSSKIKFVCWPKKTSKMLLSLQKNGGCQFSFLPKCHSGCRKVNENDFVDQKNVQNVIFTAEKWGAFFGPNPVRELIEEIK